MSISVGRMQQQHHINQLLSTAATGTGVVHDVDALLMPMHVTPTPTPSPIHQRSFETRPERNLWRTEEIQQMLSIMQQINAMELLNDKSVKSEKVFRNIEELMHQQGYRKKSHVQIWTKWKFLKSTYMTSQRNRTTPRMIPTRIYETLHKILNGAGANANLSADTSECGNSRPSLDGDSSNGTGGVVGTHMVISGVEGCCTNGKADEEEDGGFGMAHPIFGFRLGLVKQEPADTGYETITDIGISATNASTTEKDPLLDENNAKTSLHSSTANIQFRTEIKQEVLEEESVQTTTAAVTITPKPTLRLKLPERKTAPATTGTTTGASMQSAARILQLPPLRIAPFAKEPSANALQTVLDRPPPPLSMHAASGARPGRIQIGNRNNNINANQMPPRKILPKPHAIPQTIITPIRLSREITVQARSGNAAAATTAAVVGSNMPRLKHVPMRKTPYSLRPDRTIPNLDELPLSPPSPYGSAYNDIPSTSRQALSAALQGNVTLQRKPATAAPTLKKRKRRLELPWVEAGNVSATGNSGGPTVPKLKRLVNANPAKQYRQHAEDDDDDVANTQRQSFKAAQQHQPPPGMRASGASAKSAIRKDHEMYESALRDLGTSLRQMQREMITDFFEQQMELARKEHEFQMKQDVLIMQAFEEQTRHIMTTARDMLGLDLKEFSDSGTNKQEAEATKKAAKTEVSQGKVNMVEEGEGNCTRECQSKADGKEGVKDKGNTEKVTIKEKKESVVAGKRTKQERIETETARGSIVQSEIMAAEVEMKKQAKPMQVESDEGGEEEEEEDGQEEDLDMEQDDEEEGEEEEEEVDEEEEEEVDEEEEEEEEEEGKDKEEEEEEEEEDEEDYSEYLQYGHITDVEEHDISGELSAGVADDGSKEDNETKEKDGKE